jgi:SAM-dependent methyltransferase
MMKPKSRVRSLLIRAYLIFSNWILDPIERLARIRALPYFIANWRAYSLMNKRQSFSISYGDLWYRAHDRFSVAGTAAGHYFWQDLWAARYLHRLGIRQHVDVGSRIDGFIAHILPFCVVDYVDVRPLSSVVENLHVKLGSITNLPFEDDSLTSISSLHVIEHIGLGRYSDEVDSEGFIKAAKELTRVMAPGGLLLLSTPVGRERLCFDAHRIFDPQTIADAFSSLRLSSFSLIGDRGEKIIDGASFEEARKCEYGCGLFIFEKIIGKLND